MAEISTDVRPNVIPNGQSPSTTGRSSPVSSPKQRLHSNGHRVLPPGWERLQSDQGVYYWNKKTGKTTWRFPEDEAKEHSKVVRAHTYVNVKPGRKQKSNSPLTTRSAASQNRAESTHPAKEGVAMLNGVSSVTSGPQEKKEEGMVVSRFPASSHLPNGHSKTGSPESLPSHSLPSHPPKGHHYENVVLKDGKPHPQRNISSPTSKGDTSSYSQSFSNLESPPAIPERHYCESEICSSPPPLPERRYADSDVSMTPPPPIPERFYESSLSSSDTDITSHNDQQQQQEEDKSGGSSKSGEGLATSTQQQEEESLSGQAEDDRKTATSGEDQPRVVQRKVAPMGDEYALIEHAWKKGTKGRPASLSEGSTSDVSLPENTAEASKQDEQGQEQKQSLPKVSEAAGHQYADIDHDRLVREEDPFRDPVAYAVVKLDQLVESKAEGRAGSPLSSPRETQPEPEPYETPVPSPRSTLNREMALSSPYEEIDFPDSTSEPSDNSFMVVNHEVQKRLAVLQSQRDGNDRPSSQQIMHSTLAHGLPHRRLASTPPPLPKRSLVDGSNSDSKDSRKLASTPPPRSKRSLVDGGNEDSRKLASTLPPRSKRSLVDGGNEDSKKLASTPPPLPKRSLVDGGSGDSRDLASTPPPLPKRSLVDGGNEDRRDLASTPPPLPKRSLVDGGNEDRRDLASTPPPLSQHDGNDSDPGDNRDLASTPPPLPKRVAVHGGDEDARSRTVQSPLQSKAKSIDNVKLDSLFDQEEYYSPANSRRLKSLNITLRRPSQGEDSQGHSKLNLSREALLLRSGVTLRRVRSSTSPLVSPRGPLEEEESTEEDESTEGEDNGLEPVNKCIRSLENSLRLKGTNPDEYTKMEKAPAGPPKWHEFRRKPHLYEEVEEKKATLSPSPSKSLSNLDEPDMDWDESDFMTAPAPVRKKELSMSTSQPNLLRVSGDLDNVFPHLTKPARVSEEAFYLRKLRLLQHHYEDVDIPEWKQVGGDEVGSVGDVNALMSAIRASWLESDKRTPPPGEEKLPKGWKRMTDEGGNLYYWHVPTGRTQYTRPTGEELRRLSLSSLDRSWEDQTGDANSQRGKSPPPSRAERRKTKAPTFMAHYLGDAPVAESELIPGQCVKVVHSCINKLTTGKESKWKRKSSSHSEEKGRVVFLQVQGMDLKWLDPETGNPISVQPINKIRVWGIGLENDREFGYVARDPNTHKHKCHVFRCDMPARAVARALLESHQREKGRLRESPLTSSGSSVATTSTLSGESGVQLTTSSSSDAMTESTALMAGRRGASPLSTSSSSGDVRGRSDRYTRISCTYIGSCAVGKAVGMAILNEAMDKLSTPAQQSHWIDVNVDIATSHIKITDIKTDRVIREHRVRFLCFLGIGKEDRYCGYIIDSGEKGAEKRFQFHGFMMEPNTDRLCLCLHSACQARYQRVMDANPEAVKKREEESKEKEKQERSRSKSNASLLDKLQGSFRKTKKEEELKSESFVVQYLGSLPVAKKEGVETVKEPVKQLAILKSSPTHSTIPHLVEFEVSFSGISITDPQKRLFSKKNFSVKNITYVVRIKSYFAFIVKEGGKYHCHVFLESEVDAGTIVLSVQNFLAPEQKQQKK